MILFTAGIRNHVFCHESTKATYYCANEYDKGRGHDLTDDDCYDSLTRNFPHIFRHLNRTDVWVMDVRRFYDPAFDRDLWKHLGLHPAIIEGVIGHEAFTNWLAYISKHLNKLAKASMIIIYCKSGRHRSIACSMILEYILTEFAKLTNDEDIKFRHLSAGGEWYHTCGVKKYCVCCGPGQDRVHQMWNEQLMDKVYSDFKAIHCPPDAHRSGAASSGSGTSSNSRSSNARSSNRTGPYETSSSTNLCSLCSSTITGRSSKCLSCHRTVCKVCIFWCTIHKDKRYCRDCNINDDIAQIGNRWGCRSCQGR